MAVQPNNNTFLPGDILLHLKNFDIPSHIQTSNKILSGRKKKLETRSQKQLRLATGHNRHGPKRGGGLLCLFHRGAGSPSNTMWPGPRSISVPSGVFNSSSIQLFGHNRHEPQTGGCAPFMGELRLGCTTTNFIPCCRGLTLMGMQ